MTRGSGSEREGREEECEAHKLCLLIIEDMHCQGWI